MSNEKPLLFQTDFHKFMEIVMLDDSSKRMDALKTSLDDTVLCEIVRYGIFNASEMITPLSQLYQKMVLPNLPEEGRWNLSRLVEGMIEAVDFVSVNALLPFIVEETAPHIVATSVIDYVSLGPLSDDDPLSRPKDIIGLIEGERLKNRGAAFGALLHVGDPRLCRLLWPIKDSLDKDEVNVAISCHTGFLRSAALEFEIDWLEGMDGDEDLFGIVASGLMLQRRSATTDFVVTGERSFPISKKTPTPEELERNRERAKLVPIDEYARRIAPRLYALERTEPPPRIMPHVLSAWGLTPATDPRETANLADRFPAVNEGRRSAQGTAFGDEVTEISKEWFDGAGQLFLCWGILNPNGPTLYCLGERTFEGERRLFFRWLHMFGGRTYFGKFLDEDQITYSDIFEGASAITRYLSERGLKTLFDTIPSFVIANNRDDTLRRIGRDMISMDAPGSKDWGREVAYLKAFGSDYFTRAGSEIRSAYEEARARPAEAGVDRDYLKWIEARYSHIPAFRDAVFPPYKPSPLTEELFGAWWKVIDTKEHARSAIMQLAEMWRGAVSVLSDEPAENAVPFEQVIEFLAKYSFHISELDRD